MKLRFRKTGKGTPPLIILHGLLGASDNWLNIGRKLGENHTVFLLDLRNHGRSPHSDEFNYVVMAEDVHQFMLDHEIRSAVLLGHSMGGKVAMTYAQDNPHKIAKLIVVDIAPRTYSATFFDNILKALREVDLSKASSRSDIDKQIASTITDKGVRSFLLKNIARKDKHTFQWKPNLAAIHKNLDDILAAIPDGDIYSNPALFIRGEQSDYITDSDWEKVKATFTNARLDTFPGAGHWVHADQPELVLEKIRSFMEE